MAHLSLVAGGVDVTSIHLTADQTIEQVWINGSQATLGVNSGDWSRGDDYGPQSDLTCLAVKVTDGDGKFDGVKWGGFLAAVVLDDGRWVCSDRTWKAYAGVPPLDSEGRSWTDSGYDDSTWPFANEAGAYGVGPWGTDLNGTYYNATSASAAPQSHLDDDFRETEFIGALSPWSGDSYLTRNATWIWSGLSLEPETEVYLRKRFDTGATNVPPNKPDNVRANSITAGGFSLSWEPSFAPQGPVTYEVVWNGLPMTTTSATQVSLSGLSIGPYLQNYAYVRAVSPDGVYSAASDFVPIKRNDTQSPSAAANFRLLNVSGGRYYFAWDAATDNVGIDSYRLLVNGWTYSFPGHLTECDFKLTELTGATIQAVDFDSNRGPIIALSDPVASDPSIALVTPLPLVAGRSDNEITLRWTVGPPGSCSRYYVQQEIDSSWVTVLTILDSRHGIARISGLTPNTAYRFRVAAFKPGQTSPSDPVEVSTIDPDPGESLLRFGAVMSSDGKWEELGAAVSDARNASCDFILLKGQLVPQLSGKRNHWTQLIQRVNDNKGETMQVIYSALGSKDIYPFVKDPFLNWSRDSYGYIAPASRFDRFLLHTGQPLNQRYSALDGAFQFGAFAECYRGNPDFPYELEQTTLAAEANPDCKWFITSGHNSESYPKAIPGVIANLSKPSVEIMRMINGNPGYAINWVPGYNVVGISPQRNRKGGWYIIDVETDRLLIRSRQLQTDGSITTNSTEEILLDRSSNVIQPQDLRVATSIGKTYGLPQTPLQGPVWTQNRILQTKAGQPVTVTLMGRSTRGAVVNYAVTSPPAHGTLTGTGNTRTYTPDPDYTGTDFFLYQATDGGGLNGNIGWVSVDVNPLTLYEQWLYNNFTLTQIDDGVDTADDADIDFDGLPTLLEYAFVGDPQLPDMLQRPRLVQVEHEGERYLAIELLWRDFGGSQPDVSYTLQASEDLKEWDAVTALDERISDSVLADTKKLILVDLTDRSENFSRRFLRVLVKKM